ncbi:MAG: pilus assembly protein CpaE [Propionibacteriaceae bacterium]|nr:pilus assembly protein CpaE [Propionibacteriaceae bacterium]
MISQDLAQQLHDAGVRWRPQAGDRFAVRSAELDGEVFTVADMVVEAREYPTGTLLAFNGTTEWALDSVQLDQALWLPLEHQLRDLLGPAFRGLVPGPAGYEVRVQIPGRSAGATFTAVEVADAYALALLALVGAVLA